MKKQLWQALIFMAATGALLAGIFYFARDGAGGDKTGQAYTGSALIRSPNNGREPDPGLRVETEYAEYGTSAEAVNFFIANDTGEGIYYSQAEELELYKDGDWYTVPFMPGLAWNAALYSVAAYRETSMSLWMGAFNYDLAPGRYRVVQYFCDDQDYKGEFGKVCYCEFDVAEGVSHNFGPISEQRDNPETAAAEGLIVVDYTSVINADLLERFLRKCDAGMTCAARFLIMTEGGDGAVVMDLAFSGENDGCYTVTGESGQSSFYAYISLFKGDVYLTNQASPNKNPFGYTFDDDGVSLQYIFGLLDAAMRDRLVTRISEMEQERLGVNAAVQRIEYGSDSVWLAYMEDSGEVWLANSNGSADIGYKDGMRAVYIFNAGGNKTGVVYGGESESCVAVWDWVLGEYTAEYRGDALDILKSEFGIS